MLKKAIIGTLIFIGLLMFGACAIALGSATNESTIKQYSSSQPSESQTESASEQPSMTASQEQAIRKAKSYLRSSAFSKKGLISQLKYNKFSEQDATFAVSSLDVDWNDQAAEKAKSYLASNAFSRSDLISQLQYNGFTLNQAKYGADKAGLTG